MPDIDPNELLSRLQKSPQQASPAPDREQLWGRLQKSAQPEEKTSAGEGLWEGLKRGAMGVVEQMKSSAAMAPTGEGMGAVPSPQNMMRLNVPPGQGGGADYAAQRQQMMDITDRQRQQSAQAYKQNPAHTQHPIASGIGEVTGAAAAAAPFAAVPGAGTAGMLGRSVIGGLTGGLTGGLPGAITGSGLGAAGAAIGPPVNQAMQAIAQKFPNLAGMATGAMGRTEEAFQRATANEVLFPIGEFVDRTVKVGHSLINEVGEKLNAAYNKLLPKVTFRPADTNPATGRSFNDSLREITDVVPEAFANDFTKLVKRVIETPVKEGGGLLSGEAFKKAQRSIGQEARQFTKWNADPNQEKYGNVLHDLQASMRESLRAHNPTEAPMLEKVDQAWARYVRLQDAAGRRVGGEGEFTPIDLLNAAKRGEGNRAFSEGNRLMQGFGTAGLNLVQGKPTNVQQILMNMAGAGVGAAAGSIGGLPGAAAGAAAGTAAGQLALPAMRGLGRATRTDTLQELGKATSRAAPVAGAGEDRRDPYVSATGL